VNRRSSVVAVLVVVAIVTGCAGSGARSRGSEDVLRLGLFATLTHAVAHVGLGSGLFQRDLGATRIEPTVLNSGIEAGLGLLSGSLDAAFIGPWPAASLYLRSGDVRVVSGAAVGGVSLVVRSGAGIGTPADLHGARIAVPDIGNTQDVSLRTWLHAHGLTATDEGGDVSIVSADPAQLLNFFRLGRLDAAWVPEPYPAYLVAEGAGRRLVDESTLWPGGRFATASLVVATPYLRAHPDVVDALVRAEVDTIRFMDADPGRAQAIAVRELRGDGAPDMPSDVIASAWSRISFTWASVPSSVVGISRQAYALGFVPERPDGILGIYRLDALNGVLDDEDLPPVPQPIAEVS
jgi:NitT/TauT family transport system substrate-binding protein